MARIFKVGSHESFFFDDTISINNSFAIRHRAWSLDARFSNAISKEIRCQSFSSRAFSRIIVENRWMSSSRDESSLGYSLALARYISDLSLSLSLSPPSFSSLLSLSRSRRLESFFWPGTSAVRGRRYQPIYRSIFARPTNLGARSLFRIALSACATAAAAHRVDTS